MAALPIVKKAADFINSQVGKVNAADIVAKEKNSLVSYVDKSAEELLVEGLRKILPEASFLTEEDTVENTNNGIRWIIDPLDGTTNFLHNIPHFSVSVALESEGRLLVGIVSDVVSGEVFYAWKGGGAYLNGSRIYVSKTADISEGIVATGFPYDIPDVQPILNSLKYWIHNARGVRRLGSAALDMAYIACGRYDIYHEITLNPWDIAGGTLLVTEAGGEVSDYYNMNSQMQSGHVIASNGILHEIAVSLLKKEFSTEYLSQLK
jgi:myo-inositol-1(or 4)-monophosphatase